MSQMSQMSGNVVNKMGYGGVDVPKRPVLQLISDNLFESIFLSILVIVVWIFVGLDTTDKKAYYIGTSSIFVVLVLIMFISKIHVSFAFIMSIISVALFCWYAYDTYTTYKKNGQDGLANTQVLLMVSLLVTIIICKFVLSSSGFMPEVFAVFFTVVSFIMIYLINNLSRKACLTPEDTDYESLILHTILFLTIYSLTGKHPLVALALGVATFAYFSYSAKMLSLSKSNGGNGGNGKKAVSNERGNLIVTTLLIIIAIFKVIFPSFTLRGVIYSKPMQFVMRVFAVLVLVVFISTNIYYTIGAKKE